MSSPMPDGMPAKSAFQGWDPSFSTVVIFSGRLTFTPPAVGTSIFSNCVSFMRSQFQVFAGSLLMVILYSFSILISIPPATLTDAALHLQTDQIVHLHRVFQRQLLRYIVCESADDHGSGILF
jgi:hypothetical protein